MTGTDKKPVKPKRPLLSQAVQAQQPAASAPRSTTEEVAKKRTSRVGTAMMGGHHSKAVQKQFKIMVAEQDKTAQELHAEALNDLFRKYGKEPIA